MKYSGENLGSLDVNVHFVTDEISLRVPCVRISTAVLSHLLVICLQVRVTLLAIHRLLLDYRRKRQKVKNGISEE